MKDNNVKIIGGKWKRKNISFHEAKGLRPTLGKVRETLFNWLGQDLNNKRCLDLFAGTGALGFEALSRNAKSCVFVENNPSKTLDIHNLTKSEHIISQLLVESLGRFTESIDNK